MSFPILANHAHVFPREVNADGTIDRLLKLLDSCDISQAVCFAPFAHQVEGREEPNGWLARELKSRDRLFGFGTIDFRRDDVTDQVKRVADLGFRGLKLHPNTQKFDVLCERALDTYAAGSDGPRSWW